MERLLLFPEPFPDESFYSLAVRYHRIAANDSYRLTSQELFGTYSRTCGSVFPCCLDALSQRLASLYSVSQLIESSTLLPLYQPFLSDAVYEAAIHSMAGAQGTGLKMRLGLTASGFLRFASFRYCKTCLKADAEAYGTVYWHRIHMAPGVCVCPDHGDVLRSTNFPNNSDWRCMVLPGEFTGTPVLGSLGISAASAVAEMQFWGLENPSRVSTLISGGVLKQRLFELGLFKAGRIRDTALKKFIDQRLQRCPHDNEFRSVTDGCDWVLRVLRPRGTSMQPFRFYFLCWLLDLGVADLWAVELKNDVHYAEIYRCNGVSKKSPSDNEVTERRLAFTTDTELRCHDKSGYSWLYQHDRKWLQSYIASHRFVRKPKIRIDWDARDRGLARNLLLAREKIITAEGKPQKVTQTSLIRYVGNCYDFLRRPSKFPNSLHMMNNIVESEHDYQVRKLTWAVEVYSLPERCAVSVAMRFAGIRVLCVTELEIIKILTRLDISHHQSGRSRLPRDRSELIPKCF